MCLIWPSLLFYCDTIDLRKNVGLLIDVWKRTRVKKKKYDLSSEVLKIRIPSKKSGRVNLNLIIIITTVAVDVVVVAAACGACEKLLFTGRLSSKVPRFQTFP